MNEHQIDETRREPPPQAEEIPQKPETLRAAAIPAAPIPWENYLRSFFLLAIISLIGFMAYRPSLLRLSLLWSLSRSTAHGDSLNWRPEPEAAFVPGEAKRVPPPEEWRLGSAYNANRTADRPAGRDSAAHGGNIVSTNWRRYSSNPWNWSDDAGDRRRRHPEALIALPPQKPETAFRAGDIVAWPEAAPATSGGSPALATLQPLPPLPGSGGTGLATASQPLSAAPLHFPGQSGTQQLTLPPLPSLPAIGAGAGGGASGRIATGEPDPAQSASPSGIPAVSIASPMPASAPAAPGAAGPGQNEPDWKNREITRPIPGAYLTVYPRLKFIGLCVPGQGYIRKYNQVGVPADLASPKMSARDGRTPYGRYYIADRHRDADGPRLYISWPSPEDARRIGLDAGRLSEVDNAWRAQSLPPQDTMAGGGVGFTGLRNWVETTEGGFTLEEPHMEEIFTALPDKAWVFIQQ